MKKLSNLSKLSKDEREDYLLAFLMFRILPDESEMTLTRPGSTGHFLFVHDEYEYEITLSVIEAEIQ